MTSELASPEEAKKALQPSDSLVAVPSRHARLVEFVGLLEPPDPASSRGRIFMAASRLFSENGFISTTTREIAHVAGVKQVMVHYYYGSKERLYEEVLKFESVTMLGVMFGASLDQLPPEEMLITAPILLMTVLHDNPQWASLLRREIADGAKHLRKALRGVSEHCPLGTNLPFQMDMAYLEAVRTGKAIHLPVGAVRECLLAIGYAAIYLAPLISLISERDFEDETVWQEWKLTMSTILKRGLRTDITDSPSDGTENSR